jgi:catalase
MDGFSSHTFKWVNAKGQQFYVKYHFKSEVGNKTMTGTVLCRVVAHFCPVVVCDGSVGVVGDEADAMKASDADCATRDLYDHIASGKEAAWRLHMQIMPVADAATYRYNVFDITKVWPHGDYPLIPVGRLVLNRNPDNYFAEVEQAAFTPAHLVPGIEPSEDKMLQVGRLGRCVSV